MDTDLANALRAFVMEHRNRGPVHQPNALADISRMLAQPPAAPPEGHPYAGHLAIGNALAGRYAPTMGGSHAEAQRGTTSFQPRIDPMGGDYGFRVKMRF